MTTATHLVVTGRVQGVGFRWSTVQQAEALGLAGWVRNLPDGTVEVWAEGHDQAVAQLLDWCRQGPQWASVQHVVERPATPEGLTRFQVR